MYASITQLCIFEIVKQGYDVYYYGIFNIKQHFKCQNPQNYRIEISMFD